MGKQPWVGQADKALIICRQLSPPPTPCWRHAKLPPALPPALNPCPLLARIQPTNLECHLSERLPPGWCEDLSCVSPGTLGENPDSGSWSQSLPASWTETLNATAELEHETAQEKRVGLVAMQVSTAPLRGPHVGASQPPARLRYRHGHSRKWGLVTHTGWWAESDRQAGSSPRSRRRRQQVGPLRPVLTPSVLEAGRPRLLLVVWSSQGLFPHPGNWVHQASPRPAGWSEGDIRFGKFLLRGGHRACQCQEGLRPGISGREWQEPKASGPGRAEPFI